MLCSLNYFLKESERKTINSRLVLKPTKSGDLLLLKLMHFEVEHHNHENPYQCYKVDHIISVKWDKVG